MKKHSVIPRGANSSRLSFLLLALLVCCLPLRAAEVRSAPPEPKTHALFMGADISVEQNHAMYRVLDVQSGGFIIKVDGKEERVAADWANLVMKVDRTLKLTDTFAAVKDLKSEPGYTLGNDPTVKFNRGLASAELQYADAQYAAHQAQDILHNVEQKPVSRDDVGHWDAQVKAQQTANATKDVNSTQAGAGVNFYNNGTAVVSKGEFDAMSVTFEVSSPQPLNDPYVVFLGQYHERGSKPGSVANWIYAQPLQPIGAEIKKIHIVRGGFPPGFEMQDFQVHLYNHGKEIATDVAPKRVLLTREEAFMYARMEYLGSHKDGTAPANPFMGKPDAEAKGQLSPAQWDQAYYVKVSKDGLPIATYDDTNCSRPADETVKALVSRVRFYPALENGRPVEGVAELKFPKLIL